MKHLFLILLLPLLFSCDNKSEKKKTTPKEAVVKDENAIETGWEEAMSAIVKIDSFDGTRILESGQGFFVDDDIIATRFSIVNQADNVIITPLNSDKQYKVTQYVGIDRINDIVLLKTESLKQKPVKLLNNEPVEGIKTIYLSSTPGKNIQLFSGKLFNREAWRRILQISLFICGISGIIIRTRCLRILHLCTKKNWIKAFGKMRL